MRRLRPLLSLAILAGSALGCPGHDQPNAVQVAFAEHPPPSTFGTSVAVRFPNRPRDAVRVYRLPDLEEVAWQFDAPGAVFDQVVGFSATEDLIYGLSDEGLLLTFDLESGRVRTLDSLVVLGLLGPTDVPFAIHADGTIGTISNRRVDLWADTLDAMPVAAWGGPAGSILMQFDSSGTRTMRRAHPDDPGRAIPFPSGRLSASEWGDVVVVSEDSALTVVEVRQDFVTLRVELDAPPSALATSPSGHRIYVALPRELLVLDRFTGERLTGTALPAAVDAIRTDPRGQYLVARVPGADSVLVIDVLAHQVTGLVGSVWSHRLPVFSPDGSLLVGADDDLVAVDPATREERGRVPDAGDAIWVTLSWDPRRPVPQLEVDVEEEEEEAGPDQSGARIFYAQLSSTQNQAWADGFVVNLRQAGLDARVLAPDEFYDRFRVVLGPFTTRSEADETARKLGQAYFIFSEDTTTAR